MTSDFREISLPGGFMARVDVEDYDLVSAAGPWHARPHGKTVYAQRGIARPGSSRTTQQLHQFLTGLRGVDHRNGDGLDNRRSNLRAANQSQNTANARIRSNNKSGYKGVSWRKASAAWCAQIRTNGKSFHLGLFATPEEAARTYDAAALELFGEFARINFPKENS